MEIGRRVIESEVPVFADADESDIDRRLVDRVIRASDDLSRILFSIEQVSTLDSSPAD